MDQTIIYYCFSESQLSQIQIRDSVQDCSNSIANALELLRSCTKPSKWYTENHDYINYISYGKLKKNLFHKIICSGHIDMASCNAIISPVPWQRRCCSLTLSSRDDLLSITDYSYKSLPLNTPYWDSLLWFCVYLKMVQLHSSSSGIIIYNFQNAFANVLRHPEFGKFIKKILHLSLTGLAPKMPLVMVMDNMKFYRMKNYFTIILCNMTTLLWYSLGKSAIACLTEVIAESKPIMLIA